VFINIIILLSAKIKKKLIAFNSHGVVAHTNNRDFSVAWNFTSSLSTEVSMSGAMWFTVISQC
jgi:hypothetical protein